VEEVDDDRDGERGDAREEGEVEEIHASTLGSGMISPQRRRGHRGPPKGRKLKSLSSCIFACLCVLCASAVDNLHPLALRLLT